MSEPLMGIVLIFNNANIMIMDQLTKSSTSEEIKEYFNAILKLSKTSEKYPVNLDANL